MLVYNTNTVTTTTGLSGTGFYYWDGGSSGNWFKVGGSVVNNGTLTNSTLRWNGSSWVENTTILSDGTNTTSISTDLSVTAALVDSQGNSGGVGQFLSSTGNSTEWKYNPYQPSRPEVISWTSTTVLISTLVGVNQIILNNPAKIISAINFNGATNPTIYGGISFEQVRNSANVPSQNFEWVSGAPTGVFSNTDPNANWEAPGTVFGGFLYNSVDSVFKFVNLVTGQLYEFYFFLGNEETRPLLIEFYQPYGPPIRYYYRGVYGEGGILKMYLIGDENGEAFIRVKSRTTNDTHHWLGLMLVQID